MWDQVHIVIAIPTRYAVFTGDNISGCGYWGSTAGGGRSGDPQLDPAASKEDQRLDQINLGLPVPQRPATRCGWASKRALELLSN